MTPDPRIARDAGLRRVRLATGWLAAGTLALTGAIVGWEARTAHDTGASTPAVTRAPAATNGGSSNPFPGSGTDESDPGFTSPPDQGFSGGDQLQSPDIAPGPSDQGPAASSGGS
jgi:hypothetical protein